VIDPITIGLAFSAAKAALGYIRQGVDLYKEAAGVGADLSEIKQDVTKHIGAFMTKTATVIKGVEAQKNAPLDKKSGKSMQAQALENVMQMRQLIEDQNEIKQYLIYQTPGLGGIWQEFETELYRLEKQERDFADAEQKAQEIAAKRSAERVRQFKQKIHIYIAVVSAVVFVGFYLWCLTWLVEYEREFLWGY